MERHSGDDITRALWRVTDGFSPIPPCPNTVPEAVLPETDNEPPEFPDNLQYLLANSLVRAVDIPEPGNTDKFYVIGHPGLFVREVARTPLQRMKDVKEAVDGLGQYIYTLPCEVEQCGSNVYVVTKKVTGIRLRDALTNTASDELAAMVDEMFTGLAKNILDCFMTGRRVPAETLSFDQFMVGTTVNDPQVKIRFVDFPESCFAVNDGPKPKTYEQEYTYEFELLKLASELVDTEHRLDRIMPDARQAIKRCLKLAKRTGRFGNGPFNAICHILKTGEIIEEHETARIRQFRTR